MNKNDMKELCVILAAVFTGSAVTRGIRNACGKDVVGTIGGFLAGGLATLGVVKVAEKIDVIFPTEEVEETCTEEDEEA